jgi:CRP/FNR family cyclic AMP-dependent transcriptional regulator
MPTATADKTNPGASPEAMKARARALLGEAIGFRDCPAAVLDALVATGKVRQFARGESVLQQGVPTRNAWLVIAGAFEGSVLHRDGGRHLLGLALQGSFFGLMSVVDDAPEGHDVAARAASAAMGFSIDALRELRGREPSLIRACERQFVFRSRLLLQRVAADPAVPLDVRTAEMLCMLATLYGRPAGAGVDLAVKLSQFDLADWLGMSRQRVNFALKQLESEGLIRLRYSAVTIVEPEALRVRARG